MQCIYIETSQSPHMRCPKPAVYIVVERGGHLPRVPMAVEYPGHYYARVPAKRRLGALYCRTHAYLMCNLIPPQNA